MVNLWPRLQRYDDVMPHYRQAPIVVMFATVSKTLGTSGASITGLVGGGRLPVPDCPQ